MATEPLACGYEAKDLTFLLYLDSIPSGHYVQQTSHLAGQGCRGLLSSSPGQGCVLFSGIIFIELQVHPSVLPASCGLKAGIIPKLPVSAGLFVGN